MSSDDDDDKAGAPPPTHTRSSEDVLNAARWDAAEEGSERLQDGDVDGAIEELTRVIGEDPRNEYAFFFLGSAYFEKGEFVRALKAFLGALEIVPTYLGAMVHAAHCLRMLGRWDDAIRMAKQALARAPNDPDALHVLGLVHMARGDRAQAREYLQRYLDSRPEAETAMEVQGLLQTLAGEVLPFPGTDPSRSN